MQNSPQHRRKFSTALFALLAVLPFSLVGCGQTAQTPTTPSSNQVHSYFGSPFSVGAFVNSATRIDHAAGQISMSSGSSGVPLPTVSGTFTTAPTGFLSITEPLAGGVPDSQFQPPLVGGQPLTGAWAVEIPGVGALANLLQPNTVGASGPVTLGAPVAMAENTGCPSFPSLAAFLYVTIPTPNSPSSSSADYGTANISSQGAAVTFKAQPFLIGSAAQPVSTVTGGCSDSFLGPLTTYPLNSLGSTSFDRVAIGASGLLVDNFSPNPSASNGAFGQNNAAAGVIGVAMPSSPVDLTAVLAGHYNGFLYSPNNGVTINFPLTYDAAVLASAFGDNTASSPACSALQTSIMASLGSTVAALPSANSLYGGEFLSTTGGVTLNDPTAANGSENCDVVIDLGQQDSKSNGLFPSATVFIGSNFPPFSANGPVCPSACAAVSFPAAAVVGKVQGNFVIFLVASLQSTPPAQLPDQFGNPVPQPFGIYLFQKSQ